MLAITTKELRARMGEIIDLLLAGEEVELNYHSKKVIISSKISASKKKTQAQKAIEYFTSPKYAELVENLKTLKEDNLDLNEKNPRLEKENLKKARYSKYEK